MLFPALFALGGAFFFFVLRVQGADGSFPKPLTPDEEAVLLRRMQQAIAEGHALNVMEALEVVKADLQTMNADMQVSQEEYAEISTIKPLFLNADYK